MRVLLAGLMLWPAALAAQTAFTGTVRDAATGAPLEGVLVWLRTAGNTELFGEPIYARTDAGGRYRLRYDGDRPVRLRADYARNGYTQAVLSPPIEPNAEEAARHTFHFEFDGAALGYRYPFQAGTTRTVFPLPPAFAEGDDGGLHVTGRIADAETEAPALGAWVTLHRADNPRLSFPQLLQDDGPLPPPTDSARTDGGGYFRLEAAEPGGYLVRARGDDGSWGFQTVWLREPMAVTIYLFEAGTRSFRRSPARVVGADGEAIGSTAVVSSEAPPPTLLLGTLTAGGEPLEGARLELPGMGRQAGVSRRGRYFLTHLDPGHYRLRVVYAGRVLLDVPGVELTEGANRFDFDL